MNRVISIAVFLITALLITGCRENNPRVVILTSFGDIHLELYNDKAPETVTNFLNYVDTGFYNETIFHRVMPDFMIQGGGFTQEMKVKETYPPVKNEAENGLKNERGTIAMARTNMANSATSQFFINVVNNPFLDHGYNGFGYCVFGRVAEGMDVVDRIRKVGTHNLGYYENVPIDNVMILSVRRE